MAARVICISRTSGALGVEVAKLVSERLGFRYLDEEIVSRVAAREKLDPDLVADVERRKSLVVRLLEQIDLGGRVEAEALTRSPGEGELGDPERYRGLIREAVRETAAQGEVVIVSHAASFALAGQDGLLRVHVTASPEVRARRLAEAEGLEQAAGAKAVRKDDAARADYLLRFYGIDREQPTHYDLVVNTDRLGADLAAALVVEAASADPP